MLYHCRSINLLIGANGAGKSNLVSFFKLLNWMTPAPGNLQFHISQVGGANSLLHDGAERTPQLQAHLTFETDQGTNDYDLRLFHAARDTLIFAHERYRFSRTGYPGRAPWTDLGAGHQESHLSTRAAAGDQTAKTILWLLKRCVVYQFHNTSETARIRQKWDPEDNRMLKEDGANLAPFLYRLMQKRPRYYQRIVAAIREVAPFFADFELEPTDNRILLQWRERNSDLVFGPHQASDGSLRLYALLALLLQPEDELPSVVILDEPELGLHPYAVNILGGLLKGVATQVQVILATQSTTLINYFDPEDVIVVDRPGRASRFQRLDSTSLEEWLSEYSLAEIWEKNVIGGRP